MSYIGPEQILSKRKEFYFQQPLAFTVNHRKLFVGICNIYMII